MILSIDTMQIVTRAVLRVFEFCTGGDSRVVWFICYKLCETISKQRQAMPAHQNMSFIKKVQLILPAPKDMVGRFSSMFSNAITNVLDNYRVSKELQQYW